jgi:hypothetical protein
VELYLHSPNTHSLRGVQLKHRDNFTFTFTLNNILWSSSLSSLLEPAAFFSLLGLKHPQSIFFSWCGRRSFAPIKYIKQNYLLNTLQNPNLTTWSVVCPNDIAKPCDLHHPARLANRDEGRDAHFYCVATGLTIGVLRFDSRRELGFLFTAVSRTALGPTQPPIEWVPGALSMRVKRPGREADHSSPPSAEVNNAWSYVSSPQYVFMAWCFVKRRDNFTHTEDFHIDPRYKMAVKMNRMAFGR